MDNIFSIGGYGGDKTDFLPENLAYKRIRFYYFYQGSIARLGGIRIEGESIKGSVSQQDIEAIFNATGTVKLKEVHSIHDNHYSANIISYLRANFNDQEPDIEVGQKTDSDFVWKNDEGILVKFDSLRFGKCIDRMRFRTVKVEQNNKANSFYYGASGQVNQELSDDECAGKSLKVYISNNNQYHKKLLCKIDILNQDGGIYRSFGQANEPNITTRIIQLNSDGSFMLRKLMLRFKDNVVMQDICLPNHGAEEEIVNGVVPDSAVYINSNSMGQKVLITGFKCGDKINGIRLKEVV